MNARQVARWELEGVTGAVVVIDVLRAFTTAAYAFAAGADAIYLVVDVDEALAFKQRHVGVLAVGEDHGMRPDGFDFPNSPALLADADLEGRILVQRTSAGTRGVVGAADGDRVWAASLVCASATAAAVDAADLGPPTYVITGSWPEDPTARGDDDRFTAALIERARCGEPLNVEATIDALAKTREVAALARLGPEHSHPLDVDLACRVDEFDFAMEAIRDDRGLRLVARHPH